jgi:hypothetical protein
MLADAKNIVRPVKMRLSRDDDCRWCWCRSGALRLSVAFVLVRTSTQRTRRVAVSIDSKGERLGFQAADADCKCRNAMAKGTSGTEF